MDKQTLINVGGMLAVGAMVFGSGMMLLGSDGAPSGPQAETPAGHHAEPSGPARDADDALNSDELKRLQLKFDELMARGRADDARLVAMKACSHSVLKSFDWQMRLADSTYASETLPVQQRLSKACEQYSTIIGGINDEEKLEWARYRLCVCLKQSGRWQDGVEAAEVYLARHPQSAHTSEVRLMYAQGLLALGRVDDAREQISAILASQVPDGVRAMALVERAQLQALESKAPAGTPGIEIELAATETVEMSGNPAAEAVTPPSESSAVEIPAEQWASIRRAAEIGDLKTARRLIGPWLDSSALPEDQRAAAAIRFAALLKVLSQNQSQGIRK